MVAAASLVDRLLFWLTDKMPCRTIYSGPNEPYLERYYVGTLLGWRFVLHRFVASDPPGSLHDHPWRRAVSLLLSRSYVEEYLVGMRKARRRVRWFNYLTGDSFHRVEIEPGSHCWSLFAYHGRHKEWGFRRELAINGLTGMGNAGTLAASYYEVYSYPGERSDDEIRRQTTEWWKACAKGAVRRQALDAYPFPDPPIAQWCNHERSNNA